MFEVFQIINKKINERKRMIAFAKTKVEVRKDVQF